MENVREGGATPVILGSLNINNPCLDKYEVNKKKEIIIK